jgi:curved DNA-binding protein CbpA
LLSRMDGHTPWAVLRELGGLSPAEADCALAAWVETGLVLLDPEKPAEEPLAAESGAAVDPTLDLDVELQREILAFEARLSGASHHEILGVDRRCDPREIKRAYFRLSKRFHPDRYFRRQIGGYASRLDRIFRHVALAYELLSDPTTREELERALDSAPEAAPTAPEASAYRMTGPGAPADTPPPPGYRAPTRMENLARLRKSFKVPAKLLAERRFKANQFHQAARVAAHEKRWLEAAAGARLAIVFDPTSPVYLQHFASIQADVHAARATQLLAEADGAHANAAEALRLLEEAVHYRPADAQLQARAAALAIDAGDLARAREFASGAHELEPAVVGHALTLSRVCRQQNDLRAAHEALAAAAAIAPADPEVVAEQKRLRAMR